MTPLKTSGSRLAERGEAPGTGRDPRPPEPIAVVDVHYSARGANAVCAVASHWSDAAPLELQQCLTRDVAPYQPGQFYRRELVPVLNVLQRLISAFEVIVIDGYVVLDDRGSPGLGAHLYEQLGGKYAVVGVAKTAYKGSGFAAPVLRGTSRRPLFVTARGVSRELAARSVAQMHGKDRIPTLLRLVDRTARS